MMTPLKRAWWMPDVGEERMGGVEMPSRKDNPDARLTIGLSIYRLPRSGLVQRPFTTHGRRPLPASAAVYRIPCLILCLAYVERNSMARPGSGLLEVPGGVLVQQARCGLSDARSMREEILTRARNSWCRMRPINGCQIGNVG